MAAAVLHSARPLRKRWLNRVFSVIYAVALSLLLIQHSLSLKSPTFITTTLFLADLLLAFMWATSQAFHVNPISRRVFPENLPAEREYPALDVVICTADPAKEPAMVVVNTALSVMAYEYPSEKLSVYVSDDGGSAATLFALMEGAKFARRWVPYCKKHGIVDRSPHVYFGRHPAFFPDTHEIKVLYEKMKWKVENGDFCPDDFPRWTPDFTPQHHPTVIEVLLDNHKDKDVPNLIYVSREKRKDKPHNFKAGALNVLLRVSGHLTNAPIVLTLDCDMYSNDPKTPLRALCYFLDPNADSKLGFVQFPQRFDGINKNDIYASEFRLETQVLTLGMDGLLGAQFMGTGGFLKRQVICQTSPPDATATAADVLVSAHDAAGCWYEEETKWGSEIGFRYGSMTEDTYTSFRLHCEGWTSVLCHPDQAAFLGGAPSTLNDSLTQSKRWYMGFLEILFSRYSPVTFGVRSMNPLQALCYAHYTLRPFWSVPVIIYAFLPQLSLAHSIPIFSKVSETGFLLYAFLVLGAYGKDFLDFVVFGGGSVRRWVNYERMWVIWGVSSHPFALLEWLLKCLRLSTFGFNVTSKAVDDQQSRRYAQGVFEFGVASPLILTVSVASLVNLVAFVTGVFHVLTKEGIFEEMFMQMFVAGAVVVQSWPIYEAMVLRNDDGKMPLKVTLTSIAVTLVVYLASWGCALFKNW